MILVTEQVAATSEENRTEVEPGVQEVARGVQEVEHSAQEVEASTVQDQQEVAAPVIHLASIC